MVSVLHNKTARGVFAHILGDMTERILALCGRAIHHRKLRLRLGLVLLCLASTLALPQSPEESPNAAPTTEQTRAIAVANRYQFDGPALIGKVAASIQGGLDSLAANTALAGFGKTVTAFFLIALMTWSLVRNMASGAGFGEVIADWVPIFVSFGIVVLFLEGSAGRAIVSTMDAIAQGIGGNPWSSLQSALTQGVEPIFKSMAAVLQTPAIESSNMVWYEYLAKIVAGIPLWIGLWVVKGISLLLLTLGAVAIIATVTMAFISVALVLALAPVMVPFLMFKPMSWLFGSWLRFLLGACMMKVVGAFLLGAVGAIMSEGAAFASQIAAETAGRAGYLEAARLDFVLHGMMLVMSLLGTLLMIQTPAIATGLLAGGAGGAGFSGIRAATQQSVGGRVASGITSGATTRPAAAAAERAYSQGRSYFAERTGAAHGAAGKPADLQYRADPRARAAYARGYRDNRPPSPPP